MEMEGEEGAGMKPMSTTPPPVPLGGEGGSPSSLAYGSGTSAKDERDEDEGHQVKVPRQEGEGNEEVGGVGVAAEASEDEAVGADPPSNDEEEDDGSSTVSEDAPMEGQDLGSESEDEDDDDMSSVGSWDDDIDSSSEEEEDDEDDAQEDDEDDDGNTDISDDEASISGSPEAPSEELFGSVTGELHPMKNPVVLKNMFDLCPPQLLKSFRLVCKQWHDLSLEAWRSSFNLQITIRRNRIQLLVSDGMNLKNNVPLKGFLNYVNKPKNHCLQKPFRRYELLLVEFPSEESKNGRIRKLCELVKRDATSLELWSCSFPNVEVFNEFIYKDFPNLRLLKLYDCRLTHQKEPISVGVYPEQLNLRSISIDLATYSSGFPIPMDWLELCSHFPSLTRLSLGFPFFPGDNAESFPITEVLRVLAAIHAVKKTDPLKLPLKDFHLGVSHTSHDHKDFGRVFGLLQELHLPLRSLKLFLESEQRQKRNVQKLTSKIDGSRLRSLIFHHQGLSTWQFPFQDSLENLSELDMADVIFENMEFLRLVPNLTELRISDYVSTHIGGTRDRPVSVAMLAKTPKGGLADVRLLKLKEFRWDYAITEDELRHFGNWFPNLTELETTLDDKLFPIVCEQWRNLESLFVGGAELSDEGVTGLKAGQIVEDVDAMELPPNIRLLQNLTWFDYPNSIKITDVSVFNGFLRLPQLKYLTLGKGLSKKAKAAVKETGKIKM